MNSRLRQRLRKPAEATAMLPLACQPADAPQAKPRPPALRRKAQRDLVQTQAELECRTQSLSASVSLLNATLESTPDALVVVDLHFRVVTWNTRYLTLWNIPPALLATRDGRALTVFAAERVRDRSAFVRRVDALRLQPDAQSFDTFELTDGRTFERYVSPQRVGQRCVGTVVAWRDVTAHRQAEALRVAKEVAEAASQAKSAFLSRMSHELRTPLNAILGFSDLLLQQRQAAPPAVQQQHVERIRTAGQHLLSLIDDVLDVARIESGAMQVRDDVVDAAAALQDAARSLQVLADLRGVQVQVALQDAPADTRVVADGTRLQQVLLNLLSNAIKYNRPGGNVVVQLQVQGGRLRFVVTDNGLGLDGQQLQSLFEPFNRLGRERSSVQGTGIGLVISRRLVELMGGRLEVCSQPEQGSEFSFALPRCTSPAARQTPLGTGMPAPRDDVTGTVLYIDDDEVNRVLMQALMALRPNLVLHLAADGSSGIAAAAQLRPDLLLVDMRLPDMDGLQVMHAVRALPGLAQLPCLAVSANAMSADIANARQQGFDGYITKPIHTAALFAAVDRLLGGGTVASGPCVPSSPHRGQP